MNSDSEESKVAQSQHEFEIKMNKDEIEKKIKDYLKKEKRNDLSPVQIKQLTKYMTHLRVVPINKLTQSDINSINYHIDSAISTKKTNLQQEIQKLKEKFEQYGPEDTLGTSALKKQKINILEQLERELNFLPYEYLSKADSDYFTNQLELLSKNKYILREHLLKIVNRTFSDKKIDSYPYSYIDEVNKLKLKVRRKPFIVSVKTKDKILYRLKKIIHDYYIHPSIF